MKTMLAVLFFAAAASAQCVEGWRVEPGTVTGGLSWNVRAAAVYRGDLYFGGEFTTPTPWIARRQGGQFVPVGGGLPGPVYALLVHDDRLYAGGPGVRAWDGSAWTVIAATGSVLALCEWNGDLYAGGRFTTIGGVGAYYIARWNGAAWAPLGPGVSGFGASVQSLGVFQGSLVAGGSFTSPGGGIAAWDGKAWSGFGNGFFAIEAPQVWAVREYHGQLYAGGIFDSPGHQIARWNGASWENVGGPGVWSDFVFALHVWNDRLVAGGEFQHIGGTPSRSIAFWDGAAWEEPVGGGVNWGVSAFADRGDDLIVAGVIEQAGALAAQNWAVYGCSCYPDCNADGILNLSDFGCFRTRFALAEPQADCNADGVLNLSDFGCFQTKFALGCP